MKTIKVKDLRAGQLFKLRDNENSLDWVKGYYDRKTKKYECYKYNDVNHEIFLDGTREVFTDDYE